MDTFMREMIALPPMDADQEFALARLAQQGDIAAREALIRAGMRPVVLHARMRGLRGEDLRDAVQAGAVGLIRAVDRFDPERGTRLATYAWRWIGSAMTTIPRSELPLDGIDRPVQEAVPDDGDVLDGIPDAQAEVLRLRFGIGNPSGIGLTQRAVAARLGLTVSQVRTIEGKAMRQLRVRLAKVVDRAPPQGGADPL